jgi:toxin ParE1/3/4
MVAKVVWTDTALFQLKRIHNYYKVEASETVAQKVTKSLVRETLLLELNPMVGTKEPLLSNRKYEYRFLVKKNYKIIYRYDDQTIYIVAVFDTRQNPEKIKPIKHT